MGVGAVRRQRWLSPAVLVYVVVAAAATTGLVIWDRSTQTARVPNAEDPRVRAKAAAQSITGQPTVRRVDLVDGKRLVIQATSRYYSDRAPREVNREYLATEGRLIVQLILHDVPEIGDVRVELYRGRYLVASVDGRGDQTYEGYAVTYEGPLK